MIEKDPVAGTYTADLAQTLLWWPRVIKVMLSWVLSFAGKKKKVNVASQLYFFWNYYFIMQNQPYSSFPSLWAAHPGSPSFAQLQDSCFQMLSNTTDEFGASSQDHCVPVNLLRHFHRHNRTAHTALWPASMETM